MYVVSKKKKAHRFITDSRFNHSISMYSSVDLYKTMSINLSDPYRYSFIGSKEENEIRAIFYKHWGKMKNQMKAAVDEINTWRSQTIQNTNAHADTQIRTLDADYRQRRAMFDRIREENLEIAKAYHQTKEIQPFSELCIACRSLQFQVAHLENLQAEIFRPQVITVEEPTRRSKQDNRNIHMSDYNNRK